MPPVVAAAATGLAAYASGATILSLTVLSSAFLSAGISLALGAISYALTPKPKGSGGGLTNQPGTVAVRQSDLTRPHVYGHTRVVKGFADIESTDSNKNLHLIYLLCEGELRAVNEIWVNDYCIPNDDLDVNGNVINGRFKGKMQIRKHLGSTTQTADTVAVTNIPGWTGDHRLRGTAYLYVKMIKDQDVYPTGVPNVSAIVEGPLLYDPRVSALRWSTNIAQHCRDFIVDEKGFECSLLDIDDVNIAAQMNICDEIVTVLDENYIVAGVDHVYDIIDLTSETYTVLSLQYGDQVQVSVSGVGAALPTGLSAATNYYVIPYQILTRPRIKLATTFENAMAGIATDLSTGYAATMTVTRKGEPRYHGSSAVDTDVELSKTLNDMASSMAGRAICIGGAWTLLAGAWRAPVVEFTLDDIRTEGISWKSCLSMSDSYNIVNGLFRSPVTLYQDTDYPSERYQEFIDQDMGLEAPKPINLPFTTRPTTAQRIAKIELFRGRQDIAVTCALSTKAMQVQPGDTVMLTVDRYGWDAKIFEVTTFTFDADTNGLLCKLGLRETASAIYDWSMGEAISFDPAPNTNLPDPYTVMVPSGVSYNSTQVTTQGSDILYTLQLEWLAHPDGLVQQYGDYEIQYKLSSDTEYLPAGPPINGASTKSDVVTASAGVFYDLRIRARNSLGVRSGWVTIINAVIGSSGGIVTTEDWGLANSAPTVFIDYGLANSAPTVFIERGYV